MPSPRVRRGLLGLLITMVLVTGCGDDDAAHDDHGDEPTTTAAPDTDPDAETDEAAEGAEPHIEVRDAVIPLPAGPNTALYFTIVNSGGADTLHSVHTRAGGGVALHETVADDEGRMTMNHVDTVEVPAGGEVVFEPGGLHVMIFDTFELAEGDELDVELVFERAGILTTTAVVRPYTDLLDE